MNSLQWHELSIHESGGAEIAVTPRDVAQLSPTERQVYSAQVHRLLLRRPAPSPIHDALVEELRQDWDLLQDHRLGARTVLALSGDYALGKSTVATEVARRLYVQVVGDQVGLLRPGELPSRSVVGAQEDVVDADLVPVLYLNLKSDTAAKDLYIQILAFLRHGTGGSQGALAARIAPALAVHGVRQLVVDDAHMLRTHLRQGRATLDALKNVATELGSLGGGMVLVGAFNPDSDLLNDPQLRSRLRIHELRPYSVVTLADRRRWQTLLKGWERILNPYLPCLREGDLSRNAAGLLFGRTQGFAGDVATCLADASRRAIASGQKDLPPDLLLNGAVSQRALDAVANSEAARRRQAGQTVKRAARHAG